MKYNQIKYSLLFFLPVILFLLATNCTKEESDPFIQYKYKVPEQIDDGWEVASLSTVDMKATPLIQFMDEMLNNLKHRIHGILIIKDGKLVFEEYASGNTFYHGPHIVFNKETKHNLASVTKSFTSALVGLAIDHGSIQDVDQKVYSFFPEYSELNIGDKPNMTIEHLLTMSCGLEWDETTYPYSDPRNDIYQLVNVNDPIYYVLDKPIANEPGTQFLYNSGSTNVLGEIIRKASGMMTKDFADKYLFLPLGITDYSWIILPNNVLYTSGDLKLRPRDMAKLGELYLRKGMWNGQQILLEAWIAASIEPYIDIGPEYPDWEYGYKWWLYPFEYNDENIEAFAARGWGGQNIIVFPSLNMVVVTTAGYYDEPEFEFHIGVMLMQKILEAVL